MKYFCMLMLTVILCSPIYSYPTSEEVITAANNITDTLVSLDKENMLHADSKVFKDINLLYYCSEDAAIAIPILDACIVNERQAVIESGISIPKDMENKNIFLYI